MSGQDTIPGGAWNPIKEGDISSTVIYLNEDEGSVTIKHECLSTSPTPTPTPVS